MGFTNIALNIAHCIHLARDVCRNGHAYLPLKLQHATIDDLFSRSAWHVIGQKYNVDIRFYCDDNNNIARQKGILDGEKLLKRIGRNIGWKNVSKYLKPDFNKALFIRDAMTTRFGHDVTVQDMIWIMTKHLNPTVASYVLSIHYGLLNSTTQKQAEKNKDKYNKGNYTVIHLRFESDTWTLLTFREVAFDSKPYRLEQSIERRLFNNTAGRSKRVTWYGTGSPLKYFGDEKKIHYKREFMDESKVVKPFLTEYWNSVAQPQQQTQQPIKKQSHNRQLQQRIIKELRTRPPTLVPFSSWYRDVQRVKNNKKNHHHGNVSRPTKPPGPLWVNVTNSTGALIDFVMALYAHRSIVARFSSFGNQLAKMRCRFKLGETWIYTTNYKVRKAC
eukprot:PhF_6_TR31365/c1_g1_i2/m.45913